jgi:CheY-like chemotaxis protein
MRKKQNAMQMSVEEKVSTVERGALLCVADAGLAEELTRELKLCAHVGSVRVATNLPDLIERIEQDSPYVILLDDGVFQDAPLSELLRQLTRTAPVILLASAERQGEILRMVAEGEVEFVARHGDFIPLAACLVERRLRWAQRSGMGGESPWAEMPEDVAEYSGTRSTIRLRESWAMRSCCFLMACDCPRRIRSGCRPGWTWRCGCAKPSGG